MKNFLKEVLAIVKDMVKAVLVIALFLSYFFIAAKLGEYPVGTWQCWCAIAMAAPVAGALVFAWLTFIKGAFELLWRVTQ